MSPGLWPVWRLSGGAPRSPTPLVDLKAFSHAVPQLLVRKGFRSMCSLPLLSRDRVIGCLNLASSRTSLCEQDLEFLSQVAGQIALAVDNAVAYQEIHRLKID